LITLAFAVPSYAKPAAPFTINWNQGQFQWRAASWGGPFGFWSDVYQNDLTTSDAPFTLTGNALHTAFTFSPSVTNLQGASTNYVYDENSGLWIQHEGTISYVVPGNSYYGYPFTVTSYWRGYLDFGGKTPSDDNFVHGVVYQWVYIYQSNDFPMTDYLPYAQWDSTMGAWLVGFSIYPYDKGSQTYPVATGNPFVFVEPVPASNYNPLGL
jgi:hypothetical protein